ncbi:50S ribosomal protein [Striga asiatica]|uniref:50S ribosomal protein n=1 Tax=Striga asiatica TaxID=4170 RepID=A0A5A7R2N9_STRAF|nr:50S ribosomal protein [Striga asiatica]
MALLFTSSFSTLSSPSSSTSGVSAHPFFRFCHKSISLHPTKAYVRTKIRPPFILNNRGPLLVKASSDVSGTISTNLEGPPPLQSDGNEESIPVENLPLESKLQEINEQRIKMKLAKKIRLRRKRLVQKRHLRKKGRWPPSKMKKNMHV